MFGGWTMPAYFFRSEPGTAELRRVARRESGRVCQRVLMIANLLEGMEHEEAAPKMATLSRPPPVPSVTVQIPNQIRQVIKTRYRHSPSSGRLRRHFLPFDR